MTRFFWLSGISFLICCFVAGCGTSGKPAFSKRQPSPAVDVSKIPDAVPRHEPRGRYGNPKSYVVFGRRYYPMDFSRGFAETGVASWYGPNFHGKKTSSQETYDMYQMTAAHKTLPIPSYVEVTNLRNGRKIIVRVNDRGPFHDNRIIDLSYVAAKKLDIVIAGTGMVEIRAIDPSNPQAHFKTPARQKQTRLKPVPAQVKERQQPQAVKQKQLFIQMGAFSDLENARKFRMQIQQTLNKTTNQSVSIATFQRQGKPLYKVRIGPIADIEATDHVVHDLNEAGLYDHHVLFQ